MEKKEFVEFLKSDVQNFEVTEAPHNGSDGVFVKNKVFDTETHFTNETINEMELKELITATHHGKNIEQMTRVTGYFSKISKWNKGKKGELRDRHRVDGV